MVMEEFVEFAKIEHKSGICGILAQYANSDLVEKEKGAWERAMVEKYGDKGVDLYSVTQFST